MKRLLVILWVAALCSIPIFGQAPAPQPAFDVASIQASTRQQPGMRGGILRGNRYEIRNAHMVDLIRTAYNVQQVERITGGARWRGRERAGERAVRSSRDRSGGGCVGDMASR